MRPEARFPSRGLFLILLGCSRPAPNAAVDSAAVSGDSATFVNPVRKMDESTDGTVPRTGDSSGPFRAPASQVGQLVMEADGLRFFPCGRNAAGLTVADAASGEGVALVREFDAGENGLMAMVRVVEGRVSEIRYAGLEGPGCDRLPPEGEVEARGNEPFWTVTVDGSGARLRTPDDLDGMEFRDGSWSRPAASRWRYTARREHGGRTESLTLDLREERCADSMSGARYPFNAVLTHDGIRVKGCALEGRKGAVRR